MKPANSARTTPANHQVRNRFQTETRLDNRHIASRIVKLWSAHEDALAEGALPYLDDLMEAIVAEKPIDPESLMFKLHQIVPGLHHGTARRLVNLKFGNPLPTEILSRVN